jgi:hypothetical protein
VSAVPEVAEAVRTRLLPASRRAWLELLIPVVAGLAFLSPMLLTHRGFGVDWTNHLWLIQEQAEAIRALGHPSRFISAAPMGALYPEFAFYGSSMYTVVGAVSVLTGGSTSFAYIASYAVAFGVAWLGWWWLARELGVRGLAAHAPALIYSFAAFRITVPYAGGAYSEFIAPSALPLVVAAAIHLVRAPALRVAPALGLVVGVAWMTGSHNITLVWGSVMLAVAVVAAILALPRHGRELRPRRVAQVLGLSALAAAVNAWFLLPDLAFANRVRAADFGYDLVKGAAKPLNGVGNIFDPIYRDPISTDSIGHLYVQLPVLALAWSLVVAGLAWRRGSGPRTWRPLFVWLLVVLVAMIVLIAGDDTFIWNLVPGPLRFVQYPHRLHSYTIMLAAALVLVALMAVRTLPRRGPALWALAAVCLISVTVGTWQAWRDDSAGRTRSLAFQRGDTVAPTSWYDPGIYRDGSARVVAPPAGRHIDFPVQPSTWGGTRVTLDVPAGPAPITTNLAAGSYLVDVDGLRRVGRDQDGFAVLAREPGAASTGPVEVSLAPVHSAVLTGGTVITVVALLALVGWLTALAVAGRRRRAEPS